MMYRKPSRDPSQVTKSDSRRPLLSPLFTHFSSPETKFTQSPGSIDNISSRPRTKHLDRNTDGVPIDEGSDEDHGSRSDGGDNDRGELGRLAKGIDGIGKAYDTRMHSDFMKHANESLHSLISRRGTLLEHSAVDSGPPTSSGQHPQGHIFASNTTSANDYADIDVLKPPRNAHDEYLSQQRRLFPSPAEQARKNDEIIGNMHNWMDELLQMQEGIAELHMKLEGVEGEDGDDEFKLKDKLGTEDVLGKREQEEARSKDGEKAAGSEKGKQQEEEEEKREDEIMNEMIQQLHELSGKLQQFHATPHPTITFSTSRSGTMATDKAPETPRARDDKNENRTPLDSKKETNGKSIPSPLQANFKSVEKNDTANNAPPPAGKGLIATSPADYEPRQFLKAKVSYDYAKDEGQPISKQSGSRENSPRQSTERPRSAENQHEAAKVSSQRKPVKSVASPHPDHADLRRRVLQAQDRRRVDSIESPITPDGGSPTYHTGTGTDRRPGATRGWSTVLES